MTAAALYIVVLAFCSGDAATQTCVTKTDAYQAMSLDRCHVQGTIAIAGGFKVDGQVPVSYTCRRVDPSK